MIVTETPQKISKLAEQIPNESQTGLQQKSATREAGHAI